MPSGRANTGEDTKLLPASAYCFANARAAEGEMVEQLMCSSLLLGCTAFAAASNLVATSVTAASLGSMDSTVPQDLPMTSTESCAPQ
jgi:hypothetical protein